MYIVLEYYNSRVQRVWAVCDTLDNAEKLLEDALMESSTGETERELYEIIEIEINNLLYM